MNISHPLNVLISEFRSRLPTHLRAIYSIRDHQLRDAFDLAFFILPDKLIASRITSMALARIEADFAAQYKRKYYLPTGRLHSYSNHKLRTKVSMNCLQLLQQLVYKESEPFELDEERDDRAGLLGEEDMIIRFVKHLVRLTASYNSFRVTVGISRLLHNYSTSDTVGIYNLIVQDPERVKDNSYYRFCKGELMEGIIKRFGGLVEKVCVARGEERLEAEELSEQRIDLVRKTLERFTPWETECVVPERFDPDFEELEELAFNGGKADEEHPIEMARMHSLIDPLCYSRIVAALGYERAEERLTVPRFKLARQGGRGTGKRADRFNPPKLSQEEIGAIWREAQEMKTRRKKLNARELKVSVDWKEVGRVEAGKQKRLRFEVDKWAEEIRVYGEDGKGEVVVAIYELRQYEGGGKEECEIELEGGGRVRFELRMREDEYGGYEGAEVEIGYEGKRVIEAVREEVIEGVNSRGALIKRSNGGSDCGRGVIWSQFAFGEMSGGDRDRSSENKIASTRSASLVEFSGEIQHLPKQQGLYYRLIDLALVKGVREARLHDLANKLITVADHALDMRQTDVVEQVSQVLMGALVPDQYHSIGQYYQAMCIRRRGNFAVSRAMFERLAESPTTPLRYRARALQSIAANYYDSGDPNESVRFHLEAAYAAQPRHGHDLFTGTTSQWMVAVIKSINGDHRGALTDLERLFPFVRLLAMERPFYLYSYRNSLAVELAEEGRIEEAQNNCRIIMASPLAPLNPEWSDTAKEVAHKARRASRSVAMIGLAPLESEHEGKSPLDESHLADRQSSVRVNTAYSTQQPSCGLDTRQKLYAMAKITTALDLSGEDLTTLIGPSGEIDLESFCCRQGGLTQYQQDEARPSWPKEIDLETPDRVKEMMGLWIDGELDSTQIVEVLSALRNCQNDSRLKRIIDQMIHFVLLITGEDLIPSKIDFEAPGYLEELMVMWANGHARAKELVDVLASLRDCKSRLDRANIINHMIRYIFHETSEYIESEYQWRRRTEAYLKFPDGI